MLTATLTRNTPTSPPMTETAARSGCCQGKVLVITNDFPPRRGGIETFVSTLCAGIPADRLVVYTSATPGAAASDADLPYPVIRDGRSTLLPSRRVARNARRLVRHHGCDRVVFGAAAPLGLLSRGLRKEGVCRIVAITHGHEVWWAKTPVAQQALRRISENVDVLTYVSDYCGEKIAGSLRRGATQLTRLSPGVDATRFRPDLDEVLLRDRWGVGPEQPVVLAAGRLVRRKGHDTLVKAWREVQRQRPDAVLVIVGDGPHRHRLKRLIRRADLVESVRLVHDVSWTQMPNFYGAADVFALPCRTRRGGLEPEAFGIVFVEAAASGLPVLVGDSGGAVETVRHGKTGYVVDPRDPLALARRILELVQDAGQAKQMGAAGRRYVISRFSSQQCADKFKQLLRCTPTAPDSTSKQPHSE